MSCDALSSERERQLSPSDIRIAIVIDPSLPAGLIANTAATIGIGLGAVEPYLGGTILTDNAGRSIHVSSKRPVPILQASTHEIGELLIRAQSPPQGARVVAFPQFARRLHDFTDYVAEFPHRDLTSEKIEGLGLAGPEKWVRSLTGSLKLLR
jgi:hypothetical protein